jgi:hypothetical protein
MQQFTVIFGSPCACARAQRPSEGTAICLLPAEGVSRGTVFVARGEKIGCAYISIEVGGVGVVLGGIKEIGHLSPNNDASHGGICGTVLILGDVGRRYRPGEVATVGNAAIDRARMVEADALTYRTVVRAGATLHSPVTCGRGTTGTTPLKNRNLKTCLGTRARRPRSVSHARHPCHPAYGSGLSKSASKVGTRPPAAAAAIPSSYSSLGAVGAPYVPPV